MRFLRRILSAAILAEILILFFAVGGVWAQGAQAPAGSSGATTNALPKEWNDAALTLADRIAAAGRDTGRISLEVVNLSELGAGQVAAIRAAVEARLGSRPAAAGRAGSLARLTLSEGTDSYVWTAQWRRAEDEDWNLIAMMEVSKTTPGTETHASAHIALDKRLIWEQAARFLDAVALDGPTGTPSYRVVLEPTRLVYYESSNSHWSEIPERVTTLRDTHWLRSASGLIDTIQNQVVVWDGNPARASDPAVECTGAILTPSSLQCRSTHPAIRQIPVKPWQLPGHEDVANASLLLKCNGAEAVLLTETGDWTQPDEIQGYIVAEPGGLAVPSGSPMPMDGPVMNLIVQDENTARAIVRNLATGNYEAYVVTATCSE